MPDSDGEDYDMEVRGGRVPVLLSAFVVSEASESLPIGLSQ